MARRRKGKVGQIDLSAEVDRILEEFGDEAYDVMAESVEAVTQKAVEELRAVKVFNPNRHPSGDYSKDWDATEKQTTRLSKVMVVYNESHYRLAHLLEFGHAVKRGGRKVGQANAYPHIAEVEKKAEESLYQEVEERLGRI